MKYLVLLVLFSLLLPCAVFAEKPRPPLKLSLFFSEIVELEDAYGDGEWERAQLTVGELHEIFIELSPTLREHAGEKLERDFLAALEALGEAIDQQDRNKATQSLILVQGAIFKAMDAFSYMVHPVVLIIDQYIGEALEAVERRDFTRVSHELEEIGSFLEKVSAVLEEKGVGAGMQSDFKHQLEVAEAVNKRKNETETTNELQQLKKISKAFVWMATQ